MTKKNSNSKDKQIASLQKQLSKQKLATTPFRTTGGIIGNKLGGMFGNAAFGKQAGKWLGTGIGSIFGSGDYSLAGSMPSYNVLCNGAQIPQFDTTRQTNIVCHREYLGDITGTTGFNLTGYALNPGLSSTFPWLSTIAANYQEYRFHGVIFEFRPLITDFVTSGAPGVVVMATNYNADAALYTSKQEMENSEFAVSVKPTVDLIHGIECAVGQTALPHRYVRTGAPDSGEDLRLYDWGNFQFATQANPTQNLGELWVSYCVEFFKPILPNPTTSLRSGVAGFMSRSGVSDASPLGTASLQLTGNLALTVAATTITFTANPQEVYMITFQYVAGSGNNISNFTVTPSGATTLSPWTNTSGNIDAVQVYRNTIGSTAGVFSASYMIRCSSTTGPQAVILTVAITGVTSTTYLDCVVSEMNPTILL